MNSDALVQIPLGGGQEEAVDQAYVPPGKCIYVQNAVFPDGNTIKKRYGMSSVATVTNGVRLFSRGGEVLVTDGHDAWGYSTSGGLRYRGPISPCMPSRTLLGTGNYSGQVSGVGFPVNPYGAIGEDGNTGIQVRAWNDGVSIQATLYDRVRDATISTTVLNDSAGNKNTGGAINQPRVVIVTPYAFVFYWDRNDPNQIVYRAINLLSIGTGWTAQAQTALTVYAAGPPVSYGIWDATHVTGTSDLVLCGTIGNQVAAALYNVTGTTLASPTIKGVETIANSPTFTAIACSGNSADGIAFAYAYHTGSVPTTFYRSWAMTDVGLTTTTTGPIVVESDTHDQTAYVDGPMEIVALSIVRLTGSNWMHVFTRHYESVPPSVVGAYAVPGASAPKYLGALFWNVINASGSSQGLYGPLLGYQTQGKAAMLNFNGTTRCYVPVFFADGYRVSTSAEMGSVGQTGFLLEIPTSTALPAWVQPTAAATYAPTFTGEPIATNADVAVWTSGLGLTAVTTEQDQAYATSLAAMGFDFQSPALYQQVSLGDWTWLAAGVPMIYDGQALTEVGFLHQPIAPQLEVTTTNTAEDVITSNTALEYRIVYAWVDTNGNVHRSPPSAVIGPTDTTQGGTKLGASSVQLSLYPCRVTYRQTVGSVANDVGANPVRIEVYRNSRATGSIFYLVAVVPNDPTVTTTITFNDNQREDSSGALSSTVLYSIGGLESNTPPSLSCLAVHANRIFGTAEDGRTQWFTTPIVGGEAPKFTLDFTQLWPEGPATAAWSLEGRLHVATKNRIFYTTGSGPADNGAGNDLAAPQAWQYELGVIDPRCLALTQAGAIFMSQKGLYLESRGFDFRWLGEPMKVTLGVNYPYTTAVVASETDGWLRCFQYALGGSGVTVHWDSRQDRWATHVVSMPSTNALPTSATLANGQLFVLYNGTTLAKEDTTTCMDDANQWVTLQVVTGWIKPAELQGWTRLQRVSVLGESVTPHNLKLEVGVDYSTTYNAGTQTWLDTDITNVMPLEQMRFMPAIQRGEAFRVRITDETPPNYAPSPGNGPILRGLAFRVRDVRGEYRNLGLKQNG